mgnify:CR=1 FL=1
MPKDTFFKIAETKRERLLRQAARMFVEKGLNQTDMAGLAERAGISKGSIYTYFDSKESLYLYVCRDGLERSRKAIYGTMDPAWHIYRQVDHIFRQGARFVLNHSEYLILYINVASAGMERFSEQISHEVEQYTADHLKRLLRRDMAAGLVRNDLDVNMNAFMINSLYIVFMTSLISSHFKIRIREYLEIEGDIDQQGIDELITRTTTMIHNMLRPAAGAL